MATTAAAVGRDGRRRIRAAVLWRVGEPLEVTTLELDPPGPGEVEVRVEASGVCGSDIHQLLGEYDLPLPCVLGHEGAGVVTRVGPSVGSVAPGDHVVLLWRSACGRCAHCLDGRPALCEAATAIRTRGVMPDGRSRMRLPADLPAARGGERAPGREIHHFVGVSAFADHVVVQASAVVPVRRDVPLPVAALVGCGVVTGVGAVWNAARVRPGQSVAVFGCGGVGLNVVQAAALAGAHPLVAVDAEPAKEPMARALGATHFVDGRRPDLATAVSAAAAAGAEPGADVCFEVIGLPAVMEAALGATRRGGTLVLVGIAPVGARLTLDANLLVLQEKTVRGSVYGSGVPARDIPRLLDLYAAGRLRLDELVTARYPLSRINDAVAEMRTGRAARVLVENQR